MADAVDNPTRNLSALLESSESVPTIELAWALEDLALSRWRWFRYSPTGPDAALLQAAATYRLVAAQQETADLHQIVRQLNERLAKLERG